MQLAICKAHKFTLDHLVLICIVVYWMFCISTCSSPPVLHHSYISVYTRPPVGNMGHNWRHWYCNLHGLDRLMSTLVPLVEIRYALSCLSHEIRGDRVLHTRTLQSSSGSRSTCDITIWQWHLHTTTCLTVYNWLFLRCLCLCVVARHFVEDQRSSAVKSL